MSIKTLIPKNQINYKYEEERKNSAEDYNFLRAPLSVTSNEYKFYSCKNIMLKTIIKNGSKDDDGKSGRNYSYMNESNENESIFKLNDINIKYLKCSLNINNSSDYKKYDKDFEGKTIESKIENFTENQWIKEIPDFEHHLYKHYRNVHLFNQISKQVPLISRVFTEKKILSKRIIFHRPIILKPPIIDSKSSESSHLECLDINEDRFTNETNEEIDENFGLEIIKFNPCTNFLLNFEIKKINIEDRLLEQNPEEFSKSIGSDGAKIFLNNLCEKIINSDGMKNSFNYEKDEFVESKTLIILEEKNEPNPKRKKENHFEFKEFEVLYEKLKKKRIKNLKQNKDPFLNKKINKKLNAKIKKENKLNHRKEGPKIHAYLNQIQIIKTELENFPFYPSLNDKANTTIDFLKSLVEEKKEIIKSKKKIQLIKDDRNLKFMQNKRFEIIYQNKEGNKQNTLHINGFNILKVILYYYYNIQKNIKEVEKKYYSNQSTKDIIHAAIQVYKSIRQCNRITSEISTEKK